MIDKKRLKRKTSESLKETGFIREYMLVRLDRLHLAFQIGYLREVSDIQDRSEIIPVPFTPSWIHGVIKMRGDILPVISISEVLGMNCSEASSMKLAVIEEKSPAAIIFDEVMDMVQYDDKDIDPYKDATKKEELKFISGQLDWSGRKFMIVDVYKLFSSDLFRMEKSDE